MPKKKYRSARKYRCPYCNLTATREKLTDHIQDKHESMIPEGYTASRVVYDYINKKNYGTCLVCKTKVFEWDDHVNRYKNICGNPSCLDTLKRRAANNHLEDPEIQKKLLAGRRISGTYTFSDGVVHSYVGSYEKNCFEFMDQVLGIPGRDIISPGPTIWYEYKGERHPWITDWMYIPAQLCADVKDGGSNPNTRPMEDYRERQIAKEEAIIKEGKYNYIRLTDNNFSQLLQALADIRYGVMHRDPDAHIYINEAVGGMPAFKRAGAGDFITPCCLMNNVFDVHHPELVFGNDETDECLYYDEDGKHHKTKLSKLGLDDSCRLMLGTHMVPRMISERKVPISEDAMIETLTGKPYTGLNDLLMEKIESIASNPNSDMAQALILNGIVKNVACVIAESVIHEEFVKSVGYVEIYKDDKGYYATTPEDYRLTSDHYPMEVDLDKVVTMMNDMYRANTGRRD